MEERISRTAQIYVLYDPLDFDRHHTAMIRSYRPVTEIYFPLSGHNTLPLLAPMGLASGMVRQLATASFDAASFQRELHEKRRDEGRLELLIAEMQRRKRAIPIQLIERLVGGTGKVHINRLVMAFRAAAEVTNAELILKIIPRIVEDNTFVIRPQFLQGMKTAQLIMSRDHIETVIPRILARAATQPKTRAVPLLLAAAILGRGDGASLEHAHHAADLVTAWDTENALLAETFRFVGLPDEAAMFQRRAERLKEATFTSYEERARPHERASEWEPAISIWRGAATDGIAPQRVAIRFARALMNAGREGEALEALEPALRQTVVSLASRKLEGTIAARLGMQDRAAKAFAEVARGDPTDATAQRGLSNALAALGDVSAALNHALLAMKLNPNAGNERHLAKLRTQATLMPAMS